MTEPTRRPTAVTLARRVIDAGTAAMALADCTGGDDLDDGERELVGVAGLLLCSIAGQLGSSEHREGLRDRLDHLLATPEEDTR